MTTASLEAATAGPTVTTFEGRAMASPLRLTVVGDEPTRAWAAVLAEFEASEAAMSRFREDSDLTRASRARWTGVPIAVDRRLVRAVAAADRAARITGGRFDARVLADLERLGDRGAAMPDLPALDGGPGRGSGLRARPAPDLLALDTAIDLGGIGKGLALRWAAARIERLGCSAFLLDAGGDLVARGRAPDGRSWRIGIEDPLGGDEPLAVIDLIGGAVATSSIRRRRWTQAGRVVHHLIDPATGEPADVGLIAVTVAGTDPAWSEVWSKALFISGIGRIATEARARALAAWWVTTDGHLEMTPAARQRTAWVAAEA